MEGVARYHRGHSINAFTRQAQTKGGREHEGERVPFAVRDGWGERVRDKSMFLSFFLSGFMMRRLETDSKQYQDSYE